MSGSRQLSCFLFSLAVLMAALPGPALAGRIELLSQADPRLASSTVGGIAMHRPMSADGRYVVFTSDALNVVGDQIDRNGSGDVFVFDRATGTSVLVSHRSDSPVTTANGSSGGGSISADGRYIMFGSAGTDLVAGQDDTNDGVDIFLYDRILGTTALVTHASGSAARAANRPLDSVDSYPALSADGSRLAFVSNATDLVSGMTGAAAYNVFLYDRTTGANTLVSHKAGSAVTTGSAYSFAPVVSGDGRYVAFQSYANDLVAGQVNISSYSVFLYDQATGTSILVSRTSGSAVTGGAGSYVQDISRDGRYVLFYSLAPNLVAGQQDTNGQFDLFLFDRIAGTSLLVSRAAGSATTAANGLSDRGALSGDGRYVAFTSAAANLVPGTYASAQNLFLFDRDAGTTLLVSRSAASATTSGNGISSLPTISFDGAEIAFVSDASDLVAADTNGQQDAFLYDRAAAVVRRISSITTQGWTPEVSDDGGFVVLTTPASDLVAGDLNGADDVFLWQRASGTFTAVSAHPGLTPATPSGDSAPAGLSADGRYAVFYSSAPDILLPAPQVDTNDGLDVFLRDRLTGTTVLVSHVPGDAATAAEWESFSPSLSADGRIVAFLSYARNLVAGPVQTTYFADVFVYDRTTGEVSLVSHAAGSPTQPAAGNSEKAVVSRDGRYVLFTSYAPDLVAGQSDSADSLDVFLHDRVTGETVLVSHASDSVLTAAGGTGPVMDAAARFIAFQSAGSGLAAGQSDANGQADIFLYDRVTAASRLVSHIPASPSTTGAGGSSSPSISADGGFIAFKSNAPDLVAGVTDTNGADDVFLYDAAADVVTLVSHATGPATQTANAGSFNPVLSGDGRWTAFTSYATDLVPGMIDNGQDFSLLLFDRVSGALEPVSQYASYYPAVLTGDGGAVAYIGAASDLEPRGDGGLILDDRHTGEKVLVSSSPYPWTYEPLAFPVVFDDDGGVLAFASRSSSLVPNDFNQRWDAFVLDRSAGASDGLDFFTLPPCRLLDSRVPQSGPAFASGSQRIVATSGLCGLPATARAISVNITVTQPTGAGHLTIGPSDQPLPVTSTINFGPGQTRANNAILPLPFAGLGTLRVAATVAGGGTVHVLIDVNGYFD